MKTIKINPELLKLHQSYKKHAIGKSDVYTVELHGSRHCITQCACGAWFFIHNAAYGKTAKPLIGPIAAEFINQHPGLLGPLKEYYETAKVPGMVPWTDVDGLILPVHKGEISIEESTLPSDGVEQAGQTIWNQGMLGTIVPTINTPNIYAGGTALDTTWRSYTTSSTNVGPVVYSTDDQA